MAVPKLVYPRNTSAPTFLSNGTSTRANTTATGTAPSTPSATDAIDTSCGQSGTPFTLKIGQPGGFFDGWWLAVSGNGLLFSSEPSRAARFSVEATGHLCPVGFQSRDGYPVISTVENRTGITGSDVWLLGSKELHDRGHPQYAAVACAVGTGQLVCVEGEMTRWVACGIQLGLAEKGAIVAVNGLNCTDVVLTTV